MDLKNGIKSLKENQTFRRILEVLLAIGNYLNGVEVNSHHALNAHPSSSRFILVRWLSTGLSVKNS